MTYAIKLKNYESEIHVMNVESIDELGDFLYLNDENGDICFMCFLVDMVYVRRVDGTA